MKLLFLTNKTKNEKVHTTMQIMSKKQIKKYKLYEKL